MKETKESEMCRGAGVNIRIFPDGIESEPSAQTFMLWGHPLLSLRPALFIYHAISVGQSVISLFVKSKPEKGGPSWEIGCDTIYCKP